MAIATALAILGGILFGDLCAVFAPWANAYILLLKITAVPYLIGAIIEGVGRLGKSQAKEILKRGALFIALAWGINICIIYAVKGSFPLSAKPLCSTYASTDNPQLDFAKLLIPDNIFYDLSNNIIPAIVIFSLLIGIALMHSKDKQPIMLPLSNLVEALTRITSWIARITPYGTFLIIANQIGTIQLATIKQVSTYVILYILGAGFVIFWIFPRLISQLTQIPAYRWLQQMLPILLIAYTTNVVIVCLPYIVELIKKELSGLGFKEEDTTGYIQGLVSVIFNLPLGSLFITVFVFFIAVFYGVSLGLSDHIGLFMTTFLTSIGAVGLGSWINSLNFIFDFLGLPSKGVTIYLTAFPFTSGFQSMISVVEIASLSLLVILSYRKGLVVKWKTLLPRTLLTLAPLCLVFGGIYAFNPFPKIENETKSIYELKIHSPVSVSINPLPTPSSYTDPFERILATKTLRVGYNPSVPPFCFLNVDQELVGYDIALAHELAFDLGCSLEFVPMNYQCMSEELSSGLYDIAMSAVSLNEERIKNVSFARFYLSPKLVLIAQQKNTSAFRSLDMIQSNAHLKIAVLQGSSFATMARALFPNTPLLLLSSYEEFLSCERHTALLWEEEEALAWQLQHPHYRLIAPKPSMGKDCIGYAVMADSFRLQNYLDQWFELKKSQNFLSKQYDLWVKGKTEIVEPKKPRWSLIQSWLGQDLHTQTTNPSQR